MNNKSTILFPHDFNAAQQRMRVSSADVTSLSVVGLRWDIRRCPTCQHESFELPSAHRQSCLYQLVLGGSTFPSHIRSTERDRSPGTSTNTMCIPNFTPATQNFPLACLQRCIHGEISLVVCMSVYLDAGWFQFSALEGTVA